MQTLQIDGQTIRATFFRGKSELKDAHPKIYEQLKDSVFREFDPMMAKWAEKASGWVFHDGVKIAHPEDTETSSSFERIYKIMDDHGMSDDYNWLVFNSDVECERSLGLMDRNNKVAILGNLTCPGVVNSWGQLFVYGETRISGILYFDSNNGGFTQLNLVEPVGLIATSSNVFDVNLHARHFFDPIFRCGFANDATSAHEQNILARFSKAPNLPNLIDIDGLASFFERFGEDAAKGVRNGEHFEFIESAIFELHANTLPEHFDSLEK